MRNHRHLGVVRVSGTLKAHRIPTKKKMDNDVESNETQQQQRAFLREQYLRLICAMSKKHVDITLYGKKKVSATFGSADVDMLHFQVTDLETPLGTLPAALIRTSDIVSVKTSIET